jgi:hypothetical protein
MENGAHIGVARMSEPTVVIKAFGDGKPRRCKGCNTGRDAENISPMSFGMAPKHSAALSGKR